MNQCVEPALVSQKKPNANYFDDPSRAPPCLPSCPKLRSRPPPKPYGSPPPKSYGSPPPKSYGPPPPQPDFCDQCYREYFSDHRHGHDYIRSNRQPSHRNDSYQHDSHSDPYRQKCPCNHNDFCPHNDSGHHNDCCRNNTCPEEEEACKATSPQVRTQYIIPCYRYEDGRIEQYVPIRHGPLPKSVYARNGMQDQIHGYRGARQYLCACDTKDGTVIHKIIEPLRPIPIEASEDFRPVKKMKDKKY